LFYQRADPFRFRGSNARTLLPVASKIHWLKAIPRQFSIFIQQPRNELIDRPSLEKL
jgi:hypothetical protein